MVKIKNLFILIGFITEDVHSYDYISFNRIYELLDTREKGDFL